MTLLVLGLAWTVGLIPVAAWSAPWWMGAAWVAVSAPAAVTGGPLRGRYGLVAAACSAAAMSGVLLTRASSPGLAPWREFAGAEVVVDGVVTSEPQRGLAVATYELRVAELRHGDGAALGGGKLLVSVNQYDRYLPGDRLRLRGRLEPPGDDASAGFREYLERRGVDGTMYRPSVEQLEPGKPSLQRWLTSQRLKFDGALQRSLPEPEASLAGGIAFGRDDGLSRETLDDFNRSGLRHLVAVSGSNVTLVAGLMYFIFIPLIGRRWAWIPAALAITAYLGAAGLAPSVVRSGLMAGTFLAGAVIGRPQSGAPALCAAVILMTGLSPQLATDTGFILSATATAGIIAFHPALLAGLRTRTTGARWLAVPDWVLQVTSLTTAATVATVPLTWAVFGRVSLISLFANVVVEPVFVVAFWASIATACVAQFNATAGAVVGDIAFYPLAFIVFCARQFARLPGGSVEVASGSTTAALAAYAVLAPLALVAYRYPPRTQEESRVTRKNRASTAWFIRGAAAGMVLLTIIPVSVLSRPGDGGLTVRFFDVGQGDAAFLTTPHGHQILIDGGASGLGLARNLSSAMPHWDRSVDAVILSHPEEDHMGGLPEVAARYLVGELLDNGVTRASPTYAYLQDQFKRESTLAAGDSFEVDGVGFQVLWPPADYTDKELNDTSLIIRVTYRDVSFLFTGDSEAPVHRALISNSGLRSDVLKVPHHGSKTTDPALFSAVSPALAVISIGADNTYGHPHQDTLAALSPYRVIRTDQSGTVKVRTDGTRLTVSTER